MKFLFLILFIFSVVISAVAQTWSSVGTGMNNFVLGLEVYNGELYAGGQFYIAGGDTNRLIAKWDGTTWTTVGGGMSNNGGLVKAFTIYNNELYFCGGFIGPNGIEDIARWDGTSLSGMNFTLGTFPFFCIESYNALLYAGGPYGIVFWNGTSWTNMGSSGIGHPGTVDVMKVYNGELYVGGEFTNAGTHQVNNIAKWNGTSWSAVGGGMNGGISSFEVYNQELYAGGTFDTAGGIAANNIAKWDGNIWSAVGTGSNGDVSCLAVYNSELYAGGNFTNAGGNSANHIAKWNGTTWSALGTGTDSAVYCLAVYDSTLYIGGNFIIAGGISANYIAKWNGVNGIIENSNIDELNIYPSLAFDKIFIKQKNSKALEIQMFDVCGRPVKQIENNNQLTELSINNLSEGVFLIQVKTAKEVFTKKIVVQR